MFLSDFIKDGRKGHVNFDFVDVQLDSDNRIFIDPVVLGNATDEWSIDANKCVQSFFDSLFEALKKISRTICSIMLMSRMLQNLGMVMDRMEKVKQPMD